MDEMPLKKVNKGRIEAGEVRNPHGRPQTGKAIAEFVRAKMREIPKGSKKSYGEMLVETWAIHAFSKAENGNSQLTAYAWRMLAEYDSGKPVQAVVGVADGEPIKIIIEHETVSPK